MGGLREDSQPKGGSGLLISDIFCVNVSTAILHVFVYYAIELAVSNDDE